MSLFCAISGQPPLHPVVSTTSGQVYERDLVLKYLSDNDGKDPITGENLSVDQLINIKTAPSTPSAPPRPPTFTSIPSLLHVLQAEWDSSMLELLALRKEGAELRQELSHALYKEDAAMRVLARVTRERDEAREALASVKATLGSTYVEPSSGGDVDMPAAAAAAEEEVGGLPADAKARVEETSKSLSATRKKRKPPAGWTTVDQIKTFVQTTTVPSMHGTKPPGISALALGGKEKELVVTGGFDKQIQIYSLATSKILATLKGHTKKVTSLVVTSSLDETTSLPTTIVSSSLDKSVRVWTPSASGGKTPYTATTITFGGEVTGLSLHPSETLVAASLTSGGWSIIDLTLSPPSVILSSPSQGGEGEGDNNTTLSFHPDGTLLGVGSHDSHIRIYDILTGGSLVATFPGHSEDDGGSPVTGLTFSENGYTLASSSEKGRQVKIWDLRKLSNTHSITLPSESASSVVSGVCFDYSGQFLLGTGTEVRVWALGAGKVWDEVGVWEENAAEVSGGQWGVEGARIVVAGVDRCVRVFEVAGEEKA
ncbi:WD40 repeat-like protein [Meredithblackwellia eburnea MCA 4105]